VFFFFQAEDGIRDLTVTGVQTCALPIYYGPYQFPEKLIPLMIVKALRDEQLPVYGDGMNVRDWIHVEDHCAGVVAALFEGKAGRSEERRVGKEGRGGGGGVA